MPELTTACGWCGFASTLAFHACPACGADPCPTTPDPVAPPSLADVPRAPAPGLTTGTAWDALGGDRVPFGVSVLFTAPPGRGKTLLALALAGAWVRAGGVVDYGLYEMTPDQFRRYADLVGVAGQGIMVRTTSEAPWPSEDSGAWYPMLIVVDSLQGLAAPSEVLALAQDYARAARAGRRTTVLLLGHVTKDWDAAGPEALVHEVDAEVTLEVGASEAERVLVVGPKTRCGRPARVAVAWPPRQS